MTVREARCSCGALRAEATGEPARVSVCHCLNCKRRTGSAFAYNATFPSHQVETHGTFASYTRTSDEGYWGRFHFCPGCGSNVFYEIERRPGMVTIPVGAFADPAFPEPAFSVYAERQHSWLAIATEGPLDVD